MLTSKPGKPASGFFVLTAANGPVAQYTVRVAAKAAKVSVAPAAGSLALNGFVEVTVTVTSKIALTTQIVVEPGNLSVTVVYKPKPRLLPAPPALARERERERRLEGEEAVELGPGGRGGRPRPW